VQFWRTRWFSKDQNDVRWDGKYIPLKTHPYQIEDPCPTWTSPVRDALGATNASLWTWGPLSTMFISVRCLETGKDPKKRVSILMSSFLNSTNNYCKLCQHKMSQQQLDAVDNINRILLKRTQKIRWSKSLMNHFTATESYYAEERLTEDWPIHNKAMNTYCIQLQSVI
jgi:hypothetical protein